MAKAFKSRIGKIYYIKPRKTKKGNTTYFLTTKLDNTCLDDIPEGYEIYENYSAQMLYMRKKKPSKFTKAEIAIIKKELTKNESIDGFELDIHGDLLKIHDLEDKTQTDFGLSTMSRIPSSKHDVLRGYLMQYAENMRIKKKIQKGKEEFLVMRFCYKGAIDDWITIDAGDNLADLAANNLKHLGKTSLFNLHPIL